MSIPKKLAKVIQTIFRQALRISRALTNKLMNWLLRCFMVVSRRQAHLSKAGFALPTVMMVILVVVLLTTAILFRSFDWSKNVSNYRVNQQVVNAALPAVERARKKIEALLQDQQLPRGTPTDLSIDNVLKGSNPPTSDKYTLADENRVQLAYDLDNSGGINPSTPSTPIDNQETTTNAWRFFVDSDNNGKFDSITLYSVLFRTPPQDITNPSQDQRERLPLEARALPMQEGQLGSVCASGAGTSASLVGTKGWYTIGSQLKKSFFVYVATVPITDPTRIRSDLPSGIQPGQLEAYKGNPRRFSALEYQQDQGKTSVGNNAVFYNDDLTITAGSAFTINGRIVTNSNLFVDSQNSGAPITLRQVSSRYSCYYLEENGKIVVGGNVAYGRPDNPQARGDGDTVNVDLFQGPLSGTNPAQMPLMASTSAEATLTTGNPSVEGNVSEIAYNDQAYEGRISSLVNAAFGGVGGVVATDPQEVRQDVQTLLDNGEDPLQARKDALDTYFRERTRKVPFKEVDFGQPDPNASATPIGSGETLQPPEPLMFPFNPSDGKTAAGYAELSLKTSGNNLLPKATKFETQEKPPKVQAYAGDRVVIGNNLPQSWLQDGSWVGNDTPQNIEGTQWDGGGSPRQRKTRVQLLSELGNTSRDQFWEQKATKTPANALDSFGGLRVVTGAGIYLPPRKFPNIPTDLDGSTVVWPDTMPVIPPTASVNDFTNGNVIGFSTTPPQDAATTPLNRPFLQMRATAVYHYTYQGGKEPIACVSSFYDPTTADTARNAAALNLPRMDVSGGSDGPTTQQIGARRPATARSNNGITYPPPTITFDQGNVRRLLRYQADLVYPNGRLVNPLLAKALRQARFGGGINSLPLSQKAAIDTALCGLQIAGVGGAPTPTEIPTAGYRLPHGTIKEVAFLDARQIKSIDQDYDPATGTGWSTLTGKYDLPIELRQPLEVRATVLDLQKLRTSRTPNDPFSNNEYLLPNSGIIYATRDDALPDASDATQRDGSNSIPKQAAIDFKLDPTRRPNGIMLINGTPLWREQNFRSIEKGLILASNLPVYVKADANNQFNPHITNAGAVVEEFTTPVTPTMSSTDFYNRNAQNSDFACRPGDPRLTNCTDGDQWRSATILTDSITFLSHGFTEGFRSDGDYDLRNNQIDNIANPDPRNPGNELKSASPGTTDYTAAAIKTSLQQQGFFDNNFVTSHNFIDSHYTSTTALSATDTNSSYFNNFVTPIQRRGTFPELLMEMCPKLVVSECGPNDWVVDPAARTKASSTVGSPYRRTRLSTTHPAGTTVDPAFDSNPRDKNPEFQLFPRRVAFARNLAGPPRTADDLVLDSNSQPVILGINRIGRVACYTYGVGTATVNGQPCQNYTTTPPRANSDNALWFRTTTADGNPLTGSHYSGAYPPTYVNKRIGPTSLPRRQGIGSQRKQQPLLVPVLQIQYSTQQPQTSGATIPPGPTLRDTQWLQKASANSTFNLVMATGNNPEHPAANIGATNPVAHEGDFNGALANLPHFLENWTGIYNVVNGSFIQLQRSSYATAPFTQLPQGWPNTGTYPGSLPPGGAFNIPVGQGYPQGYNTGNSNGKMPSYLNPTRQWGFDVGLLSQLPDLFSQQFVLPPTEAPNEFFREVDRNDTWVQTLLCAKIPPTTAGAIGSTFAINANERPNSFCQNKTGN